MSPHVQDCNRTCQSFTDHALHRCCLTCYSGSTTPPRIPSPAPTVAHCSECRLPVDLSEEFAKLSAAVVELQDLVVDLHASLVGEGSEGGDRE